jgi:hypothetical protein
MLTRHSAWRKSTCYWPLASSLCLALQLVLGFDIASLKAQSKQSVHRPSCCAHQQLLLQNVHRVGPLLIAYVAIHGLCDLPVGDGTRLMLHERHRQQRASGSTDVYTLRCSVNGNVNTAAHEVKLQ